MNPVNRTAFVVTPKQPYVDWVNSVDHTHQITLEQVRRDATVFLLPDWVAEDVEYGLGEYWEEVFAHMLEEYYTDEAVWPRNRTPDMFRAWFHGELSDMIVDLTDEPLESEP